MTETSQIINPWMVENKSGCGIDYQHLIEKFDCSPITKELIERLVKRTQNGHLHHLLKRGLIFAHQDFGTILDQIENNKPFFIYYVRRPSTPSVHLGHLSTLLFIKWLQDEFHVPVVIHITGKEVFYKNDLPSDKVEKMALENAKEIAAIGFDVKKTFIYSERDFLRKCPAFLRNVTLAARHLNFASLTSELAFDGSESIGMANYPTIRAAAVMSSSYPFMFNGRDDIPCLMVTAIDQEPYLRMIRGVTKKLNFPTPCTIFPQFLPALQGIFTKANSTESKDVPPSCVHLIDSAAQIKNKINKYAFSGGGASVEEHKEKGGNCEVDIAYQYLRFFLEDNDKLEETHKTYSNGTLLTGYLKKEAIEIVQKVVATHQERRKTITNELLQEFMTPRQFDIIPSS
ncbi:tryptophan--tRNA ligase, cytoplasmic-like [Brevipalpus obovatus]|uniref:tryptophan--tRNA ligase, cytoplasmic-like n=1 Tax=Brevipalpus obovatus TaxID=246614 RepID=UPI003D9F031B